MARKLPEDDVLCELIKTYSVAAIAQDYGCSRAAVYYALGRLGIRPKVAKGATRAKKRDKLILQFVIDYKLAHDGCSPSLDDICNGVGVTMRTARVGIASLIFSGLLYRRGTHNSRSLCVKGGRWEVEDAEGDNDEGGEGS